MPGNSCKTIALPAPLAAAAASAALLLPATALPAGQPTAVSNLPVAVTGRHKSSKPKAKPEAQKSGQTPGGGEPKR
ncbi:MAG TPA: hypothetical protein VMI74_01400 [Burkholderiales bacterium]|nr:hypothetical protein [Burkholderiales bacterium]